MTVAIPVIDSSYLNIQGMQLRWVSNSLINIFPGQARDSTNQNDIILEELSTISTKVMGLGGLDQGTLIMNNFYNIYIIGSSLGIVPTGAIFSQASNTDPYNIAPILPVYYDIFRRIGGVALVSSTNFYPFVQTSYGIGNNTVRRMWYDGPILLVNSLPPFMPPKFTTALIDDLVPHYPSTAVFNTTFIPTNDGDVAYFQPMKTSATPYVTIGGAAAGVPMNYSFTIPFQADVDLPSEIWEQAAGTLSVYLVAYDDLL